MGIFRMYTGDDGKSVMEELQVDDPILETLKTCTGCSIQINRVLGIPPGSPSPLDEHAERPDRHPDGRRHDSQLRPQ